MFQSQKKNNFFTITVIITNYDRKEELIRAIKSVLNQTYLPKEIILIDDHSNFDIKKFIIKHFPYELEIDLIKITINKINYGCAKSRNIGIKKSKSNFIAILDSDDYWHPSKLEKQINLFKKRPSLDLIYCDQYIVINKIKKSSDHIMIKKDILNNLINFWMPTTPSTLLFKKKSLQKLEGFDEEIGRSASDHYLWFKIGIKKFNIDFIDEPLCDYSIDGTNRTSMNLNNRMKSIKVLLDKIRHYIPKEKYSFFRRRYVCNVSLSILNEEIKKKNFFKSIKIILRYLIFNGYFYKRIIRKCIFNEKKDKY